MRLTKTLCAGAMLVAGISCSLAELGADAKFVVHISVDGLRPDAVTALGPELAPNFYRLRTEGTFTDNARTDADETITLPNHATQITGRGVAGTAGHNYTLNTIPSPSVTLHTNKGTYISSVFDLAHDNGLSTCLYASKEKFVLYDKSYNEVYGALDRIGDDNGRDKIDAYLYIQETNDLINAYLTAMTTSPYNYCLLHLHDPDSAGHGDQWDITPGSNYLNAVAKIDRQLGAILHAIEGDPALNHRTTVIVTTDHGGRLGTANHQPASDAENYTIPFYVWGAGVAKGADLYELNAGRRIDPITARPTYSDPKQPVRNGDAANLALLQLGLGPVPNSTINASQDLIITPYERP